MLNFWLIARHEFRKMIGTRTFLATTIGVPLLIVVMIGIGVLANVLGRDDRPIGIVDQAGILAPSAREGGQFVFFVLLPLLIPVWLNFVLIDSPNSALAVGLSLFPLTAPVAMITRMVATAVPLWQLLASLLAQLGTAYLFVLLAARFFRADTLLANTALSWRRL